MRYRGLALGLAIFCAGAFSVASAQSSNSYFPLSQVHAGLKGVGRTVFQGDKVEDFQVEILGVLKNALAPKQDVILARLSGGPLAQTGVIAGMSGSPVYVNGRLLGAVALSFTFAKEPIAGITPIQQMLNVVPQASPSEASRTEQAAIFREPAYKIASVGSGPNKTVRLIPKNQIESLSELEHGLRADEDSLSMSGLRLPMRFGGFSSRAMQAFSPLFRGIGFLPMQGGAVSSSENLPLSKNGPQPGSMISMMLVGGDLNLNVDCTVTLRVGKELYACGHRFMLTGPTQIPFAEARVLATVPDLSSSFKIDVPGPIVGSIQQDRFGAIFGVMGGQAPVIPVTMHLDSTLGRKVDYHFWIVQHSYLSPVLLNLSVVSALTGTERAIGPSAIEVNENIALSDGESVRLNDLFSGESNVPDLAGAEISTPLTYLLGGRFPGLEIKGISLTIHSSDQLRNASLESIWSTQSTVHPGDHFEVAALLRMPSGKSMIESIPVEVPESVTGKGLSVVVGSGSALNFIENSLLPVATGSLDLHQLVKALNKMRTDNRLYALLMAQQQSLTLQGNEYPMPPPSLIQTFLTDPAESSGAVFKPTSVAGDYQTKPMLYSIRGVKTLQLKVETPGD